MEIINIHKAKTHLSRLLECVSRGEEVVIGRAGKPIARLVPYEENLKPRRGGQWHGLVRMSGDFDAPLPDELAASFRGERP